MAVGSTALVLPTKELFMQVRLRHAATAVACALTATGAIAASAAITPAFAQNTQASAPADTGANACNANSVPTQALAKATFTLQRAFQKVQAKQPATTDLKATIKILTSPPTDKKETGDSLGRAYYLGQAYILLLSDSTVKPIGRRSDYGIATDTVLTVDLLAAADTAFSKVERSWPACAKELANWRQQKPWLDALNGSINALNAQQFDSAEVLAKRSLLIERSSPYAYSVLASVENNRKQFDSATTYLQKVIELAQKDTAYEDARLNAIFDLANTATMRAEATTGADKKARVQEAVDAWHTYMPVSTRDAQVANAEQTIVRLLRSVGDTMSLQQAYAPVLSNPSKYGEQALLNAGVIATRAKRPQDAATLFGTVLQTNPYQRDAINNLAASYVGTNEHAKMIPLVDKLVSIDPNNSDNWLLYAYAYTGLLKGTKDPKLVKAYTDSLVKYNTKAEKLPTRVALTEFSHVGDKTTLSGTIENRSTTAKTYNMQVDFLDKDGNVVASQATTVGPVAPKGEPGTFSVNTDVKGVVAFRYKPL